MAGFVFSLRFGLRCPGPGFRSGPAAALDEATTAIMNDPLAIPEMTDAEKKLRERLESTNPRTITVEDITLLLQLYARYRIEYKSQVQLMDNRSTLRRERAEIDEVIRGLQPGSYGVLTSPGGVGKSFLILRAAIEIALGRPILGGVFGDARPGGQCVAYITLEDDPHTHVHNRAIDILEEMQIREGHPEADLYLRNLIVTNATTLIAGIDRSIPFEPTRPPRLVIIDTFRAYAPEADENSTREISEIVNLIRRHARALGAAVLIVHHVNKGALGSHSRSESTAGQERGASTLRDSARAAWTLWPPTPKEIKDANLSEADAAQLVVLKSSKSNHSAGGGGQWFRKNSCGVPVPIDAPRSPRTPAPSLAAPPRGQSIDTLNA
jgi:regulatory protein RepA